MPIRFGIMCETCERIYLLPHPDSAKRIRFTRGSAPHPPFPLTARLSGLVLALLFLLACNALNPLCGSARPVPVLNSISPPTLKFSQLPPSFTLTANGGNFVSSSVVVFNGATLATSVNSHSMLTVTITASMIPAPGTYNVQVHTPAGTTADVGCSSGGDSVVRVLIVN